MTPSADRLLVARFAYLGVSTQKLSEWNEYARLVLGLHVEEVGERSLRLRLDDKQCRIWIDSGDEEGVAFYGWEIPVDMTLAEVQSILEQRGVTCSQGTPEECSIRGVAEFTWFEDPLGNRVEFCRSHLSTEIPLRLSRPLSGFKTGKLGLGHVVLMGTDVDDARRFYRDVIGMRLSDYTLAPFDAQFYHVNSRHHSFAIIRGPRPGLHHLMLELLELDDVGQTYDLVGSESVRLGASLGRHSNDHMMSFYIFTPSGFMIEWGWGGREIDMETWQAERLDCGPSLWGHERTWLEPDKRKEAADLRASAARDGLKAKVVVTPGHYVKTSKEEAS